MESAFEKRILRKLSGLRNSILVCHDREVQWDDQTDHIDDASEKHSIISLHTQHYYNTPVIYSANLLVCTRTLPQWVLPCARLSRKIRVNEISCRFVFPAYKNVSSSAINHVAIISVIYCAIVMKNNCDSAERDVIISPMQMLSTIILAVSFLQKMSAQFVALPIMVCKMIICTLPIHRRTDISIVVLSWKLSMLSSVNHISLAARSSLMHFLISPLYLYFSYETLHFLSNHWDCEDVSPAF